MNTPQGSGYGRALLTVLLMHYGMFLSAAEIPPVVGPWGYSANQCTNFANASTWAADCAVLDGGTWAGSGTGSDPLRCEDPAHPRPWPVESMIEPLASARSGGVASLDGWQSETSTVHCTGFFDTKGLSKTLGIESSNASLVSIDGNAGAWGARRDRDVECPPGTWTLADRCLQYPAADPYRAFDMCPNNGTNPVNIFTGAKIHVETDFRDNGPNPLVLTRYYSSRMPWRHATWEESGFGRYWRHNYTRAIAHFESDSFEAAVAIRGNGNRHYFIPEGSGSETIWRPTEADIAEELTLVELNGVSYWNYLAADGSRERYLLDSGRLDHIVSPAGFVTHFSYDDSNRLAAVNNGFGRSLVFTYGESGYGNGYISQIALHLDDELIPGSEIRYDYENSSQQGVHIILGKVVYPDETPLDPQDNPFKDYVYNEPAHIYYDEPYKVDVTDGPSTRSYNSPYRLTGIIDENGDRYATYKYQRHLFSGGFRYGVPVWGGHGTPDENGDYADQFKITRYHSSAFRSSSASHQGSATIADAQGKSRNFHFKFYSGVLRPTLIEGGICEFCGSDAQNIEYDNVGYVTAEVDFAGNKTIFQRDEKGLEKCRIEGVSTVDSSKTSPRRIVSVWDHGSRVLLERRTYEPSSGVDLTICHSTDDTGWTLRLKEVRSYEPGSSRLTQHAVHSYNVLGVEDELPRVTTYRYYGNDEQHGLPFQLKQIDGPRQDVNDIQTFRYAVNHTNDHSPGDLIEIENALGHVTRMTKHDAYGRVLEQIDPNDIITNTTYHPRGWLTSRTVAEQHTVFGYDKVGQLTSTALATGATINYQYDSAHRLTDIYDMLGNHIHYELDLMGNRIAEEVRDPNGVLRRHAKSVFNSLNQLEKSIASIDDGNESVTGFLYDANGSQIKELDPRNPGMSDSAPLPTEPSIFSDYTYDALNRISTTTDSEGGVTRYSYDVLDNMLSVIEPDDGNPATPQGLVTSYEHNSFGELKRVTSPDSGVTVFTYDQAGNRLSRESEEQRSNGTSISYVYDNLNRLVFVDHAGTDLDVTQTYDHDAPNRNGIGRLTRILDASGETSLFYDGIGNLTTIENTRDGTPHTTKYIYNALNQLSSLITPGGKQINYHFRETPNGTATPFVDRIGIEQGDGEETLVDNIIHAPFGPPETWQFGNGIQVSKALDLSYRINRVSHGLVTDRMYTLDPANNPIEINDTLSSEFNSYQYDNLSRLVGSTSNYNSLSIGYDSLGNRRAVTQDGQVNDYVYAPLTHHLLASGSMVENAYNLDGSLTSHKARTLRYGEDSRLKSIIDSVQPSHSYKHNAFGQRVEKTGQHKTLFFYGLAGRLLEEADEYGNSAKTYVYLNENPIVMIEEDINPFDDTDSDGMLNGFETRFGFNLTDPNDSLLDFDGDSYSNLSEQEAGTDPTDLNSFPNASTHDVKTIPMIGTIAGLIGAAIVLAFLLPNVQSGMVAISLVLIVSWLLSESALAKTHYIHTDHLGTPIAMTDNAQIVTWSADYTPFGQAIVDPQSTAELNLRFPGQYYDQETGFHYNYYRDYDPETGRYIQSDPIGLDGGINTYTYGLTNPVRFVDRFGLWVKRCARALDALDKSQTPMKPSGNPLRHDYLSVSGSILSFQAGNSMLWSPGQLDREGELPSNPRCKLICDDDAFDQYVFEASNVVGETTYSIVPLVPGSHNCQSWASAVLKFAKKRYLESESCPKCFRDERGPNSRIFDPDFGRAL
ncbi:MAG: RHS repeat-associated core domain-containing protein [Pseudomonadota bacterium]